MKEFFNKTRIFFNKCVNSTIFEKKLFLYVLLIGLIVGLMDAFFTTIIMMLLGGLLIELSHVFVPRCKILGISLPDFKKFQIQVYNNTVKKLNKFKGNHFYIALSSVICYIFIKIIFIFF